MNLHQMARGAIGTVNPEIDAVLLQSLGSTTNADFTRTPLTGKPQLIRIQAQAIDADDLRQFDELDIAGIHNSVYTNGRIDGVVRILAKGGDILKYSGQTWLVVGVPELWPDWCRLIVTLQDGK